MAVAPSLALLEVIADWTSKRVLGGFNSIAPRSNVITFSRGDDISGRLYIVYQTGVTSPPLARLAADCNAIKLTDGKAIEYAIATSLKNVTTDPLNPFVQFRISAQSDELDTALNASVSDSIDAFLEARIIVVAPSPNGSPPAAQVAAIIREKIQIFKTATNPL